MDILLLGIYAFFVWLIFFKFKWLPWNKISMAIVFTIPVVALTALILTLNVVAPSTADVRVVNKVLQVVPQVRGRVIEVPVEGNRTYKKGDVLLRIDPTPFEAEVKRLSSALKADQARVADAESQARQLNQSARAAAGKVGVVQAKLDLARKRLKEHEELVGAGAGEKFALEDARSTVAQLEAELQSARAGEEEVRQKLSAQSEGEYAAIADARSRQAATQAQLDNAKWELDQTTFRAPADGTVVNLQVRVGTMAAALPFSPVMTFVENDQEMLALYQQNELVNVAPGDEAEVALKTHPGEIIKAKVDSIVWANAQGQIAQSGNLPTTGVAAQTPNRFAVRLKLVGKSADMLLPAGAIGDGAIYTQSAKMTHVIRKVFLRVSSKLNYIVPKLH
ncbi:HlyD family secretion protein [Jeongeupia chitinilytica]|uniref:MFP transporter n=1 Tax=Jeongeupia chitinilytica TaxID=1041641 RepID=A0ABQ3H1A0_9NEIS|nr:biotin/lipoyl-binding protein [Jeongeupia chitinilytica]GHD65452.1 MFP transporter [Jeongeupia chitinilytica]